MIIKLGILKRLAENSYNGFTEIYKVDEFVQTAGFAYHYSTTTMSLQKGITFGGRVREYVKRTIFE